ncbi:hypothetical protein ACEPAG_2768 [Sanghuangporus baumii]
MLVAVRIFHRYYVICRTQQVNCKYFSVSTSMSSSSNLPSTASEAQGLFPGYKHVERFGPDEDYDDDEVEECYVTLDLGSIDQTLVPSSNSYRLIGLDTTTPFLQLSRTIMRGHYKTLIGTELIFKDVSEETDPDPSSTTAFASSSGSKNNIRYFTKTDRRIQFRQVGLKPKISDSASQEQQQQHGQNAPQSSLSISSTKRKASAVALESLLAIPKVTDEEPSSRRPTSAPNVGGIPQTDVSELQVPEGVDATRPHDDTNYGIEGVQIQNTDGDDNSNGISGDQAMDVDS